MFFFKNNLFGSVEKLGQMQGFKNIYCVKGKTKEMKKMVVLTDG